jgi:diacylglycerol kinase family enzyme
MTAPATVSLERLGDAAALDRRGPVKRMLIVVNPYATTLSDRLKHLVVYALQGRYEVEAVDTQRRGHAIELAREAAGEGYDVVCAFGGDGTVNEAANGLAGSRTPLTCLPGGATNVYCRILGIPNDVVDATEHLLRMADDWRPRPADLGTVNGRVFTFSAGAGLDASVVERVDRHPHLKARLGAWYFTSSAFSVFLRRYVVRPPRLVVEAGGETFAGVTALVQNASPYTYFQKRPIEMAEGAGLESGDLSGVVLERASPVDMPTVLWRALSRRGRIVRHRRVSHFEHVDHVVIRSADERPIPLQVDGDHIGDVESAEFGIRPAAMQIVS